MPPHIFLKIVEADDALALCARPQHPAPFFFIYVDSEFFEFYLDDMMMIHSRSALEGFKGILE